MDVVLFLLALGVIVWAWFRLQEPSTFATIVVFAVALAFLFVQTACAELNQLSTQELLTLADPNSGVTCIVKDQQVGLRALVAASLILASTWLWARHLETRSSEEEGRLHPHS